MWLLIIAAIFLFIFWPRRKPAPAEKSIPDTLETLVRRGAGKLNHEAEQRHYIQIKLRLLLLGDERFHNINKAFREGATWELPGYAFTAESHDEAQQYYNRTYHRYYQEYANKVKLLQLKRAGVSHVYIWPLDHRQCDAVKKIRKPKKYAIDKVPMIPCADCTEYCACSYHPAKYKD